MDLIRPIIDFLRRPKAEAGPLSPPLALASATPFEPLPPLTPPRDPVSAESLRLWNLYVTDRSGAPSQTFLVWLQAMERELDAKIAAKANELSTVQAESRFVP